MPTNTPNVSLAKPLVNEKYDIDILNENFDKLDLAMAVVIEFPVVTAELGHLSGVTSAIQTQLNARAPIASPTFTGTVGGITATMVGLGNVTNESKATMFTSPAFTTAATVAGRTIISNNIATGTAISRVWSGSQAQYDAIVTKDDDTLYFIG